MMVKIFQYTLMFITIMFSISQAATIHHQYHHQLRMQIYSKPNYAGQVQTIRALRNHESQVPCYNLSSKRVGSYDISDPNVKITFYRAMDCKGAPSIRNSKIENKNHVMKKSRSVSIVRLKPVHLN